MINLKGFTVEEMIKALQSMPPKAKIVLASDEEGNDFGMCGRITQDNPTAIVLYPMSNTVEIS